MTGETSGPSAQDIRMASFEEKFNDLLNFVRLLVKRDTESPQSLQMYGNGEENVMNKKEDDHSDIRSLQGQPLYPSNQGDTIEPHSDVERVEQLEKQLDEVVQSMHQLITLTGTLLKDDRKAIRDLASHSPIGQASTKSLSKRETERHRRQGNSHASHWAIPIQPKSFFLRKTKVRAEKIFPHLLHDSSKKCEFHFGRPGHSLEDCHALKNKVQDLVDHGILRINEGSTPSVIIAWPPEHRKDETVIPSPQSQGPTTCGIQPVHLTTLPTLSEVGEHTVPKTQPKLMSNFRNLDDQCSSDKEKAEYRTNRCMTLKRKIQEAWSLGARCHQEIRQSEPFQGAPEPGSRIAKDEFSRPRHHHHRRGRSTH
uniref:Retrotransposon gag domain-containing protein n=1 Tax=Fagus sylvatica TaxID=28930 RepID=A0A2N9FN68_FAGSY